MKEYRIKDALDSRKIMPFADGPLAAMKEVLTANDDLKDAEDVFKLKKYKMATVFSYYAIFHATRALLYLKKYREKSHLHLGLAIKSLCVDKGLLPQEYYDDFVQAQDLREMADYKSSFSEQGAKRNLESARRAIVLVEKIIPNIRKLPDPVKLIREDRDGGH